MEIVNGILKSISELDIVDGKLIVPEGVTKIEAECFKNNSFLIEIKLPSTLNVIEDYAFWGASNLEKIEFKNGLTSIGDMAFSDCHQLKELNLPDTVTHIGENAFVNCISVKSVHIPTSLNSINSEVFYNLNSLEEIFIPKNIKNIAIDAFFNCSKVKSIKFEDGSNLKSIGDYAFKNLKELKEVEIPDSTSVISTGAFSYCQRLEKIKLPKSLKKIDKNLFQGCEKLKDIILPESIHTISSHAFDGCSSLEKISIPNSVNDIDFLAFNDCTSLKWVKLPEELKILHDGTFFNCSSLENINLPKHLSSIEDNAFGFCISLKNIDFPKSLTQIGSKVFMDCFSLENIEIPNNITTISKGTFSNCYKLKKIKLPEKLQSINEDAFIRCTELETIELPNGVSKILNNAFQSCEKLKTISLPNSITYIGKSAFENCIELQNILFGKNIKTIENSAFKGTKIKSVILPNSITNFGHSIFENCANLSNVTLPNYLTKIPNNTFLNCTSLTKINIPETVTEIGEYAFSKTNITNFNLPNNISIIGDGAFSFNNNLKIINIPKNAKKIGNLAFFNCNNLSELTIPNTAKDFGELGRGCALIYFNKKDDGFSLTNTREENSIPTSLLKINLSLLANNWDKKDLLFKEQSNDVICDFYNTFLVTRPIDEIQKFIDSHNFTFLKQLKGIKNAEKRFNLYNALYNLGAISTPIDFNGKKIDYAQKIINFFEQQESKGIINTNQLGIMFEKMECQGIKPEFNEFLIKDFDELFCTELLNEGFISRCYNDFEKVQKTNTNNHGSQRQLKPTVDKFIKYFNINKFQGVTEENREIANIIAPYFDDQEIFDRAVDIFKEKKDKNTHNNILNIHLQEPFEKIDRYAKKITDLQKNIFQNLLKTTKNQLTFDWLEKNDPENLILGKLCSCCSHIDGMGVGIMKASIVDPFVQNLVIRNNFGEIIAKSTLYVNPNEGYGVFNNVEVNNGTEIDTKMVYKKFIQGAKAFAEEYNKEHPNAKLKQINVGMNLNDLESELKSNNTRSRKILQAIDYADYGLDGRYYSGDSNYEQYIVWKSTEKTNTKENNNEKI